MKTTTREVVARVVARRPRRTGIVINGQPLVFKALAGFGAGPMLIWASLTNAHPIARAVVAGVGALVTVVDGGHVLRQLSARRRRAK